MMYSKAYTMTSRYQRQIVLKHFGVQAQEKLSRARVLIIGIGGLGCITLQYLVAAGVGQIGIVDDDTIALTNLHRQVIYHTEDLGLLKVEIALKRMMALNPDVEIVPYAERLKPHNALDIMRKYDIIIDATDNFPTRYIINDVCVLLAKPLIYGAIHQYEGQIAMFNVQGLSSGSMTYRDMFAQMPKEHEAPSCTMQGTIGTICAMIGIMQANECIKWITGIGELLANKLCLYNALSNRMYCFTMTPCPDTLADKKTPMGLTDFKTYHDHKDEIIKKPMIHLITKTKIKTIVKAKQAMLIDVREFDELPMIHSFAYLRLPVSMIKKHPYIIQSKQIVLFCQSGQRSLSLAHWLVDQALSLEKVYVFKGAIEDLNTV